MFQQENNEEEHRPQDEGREHVAASLTSRDDSSPSNAEEHVDVDALRHAATTIGTMNSPSAYARMWNGAKYMVALAFLCDAALRLQGRLHPSMATTTTTTALVDVSSNIHAPRRRFLQAVVGNNNSSIIDTAAAAATAVGPSYMQPLFEDLRERQKLFATPPEQIKYWFEYTGPMQKYYYRHSSKRSNPDYFEGRDDSGVVSSRFIRDFGGTREHVQLFHHPSNNNINNDNNRNDENDKNDKSTADDDDDDVATTRRRLLENCIAMGHPTRSYKMQQLWKRWYGNDDDRCRILFAINMVGAGGTGGVGHRTTLWDTTPPHPNDDSDLHKEQAGAASHLKRNLQEINAMCASGLIAAKIQVLVCEPIHPQWIEWMDSFLVQCGGMPWPDNKRVEEINNNSNEAEAAPAVLEDRPSPVQIVVAGPQESAEQCHDAKSGFMEQRIQGLILKTSNGDDKDKARLASNGNHDLHVSLKWSTLVTMRAVASFLQASADLQVVSNDAKKGTATTQTTMIPSFVRVSYISEENIKEAKWRMHGDFFHPAAWEVCKDSYSVSWIPNSLAGYSETKGGIQPICPQANVATGVATSPRKLDSGSSCGQWWISFTELQMPTSPEIYANEQVPPIVAGGSNFFWMLTERQRQQIIKRNACEKAKATTATSPRTKTAASGCPSEPQGVIPLGDLQSFLVNFTPNTALGKKHVKGRRPGYHKEEELNAKRTALNARGTLQTKGGDTKIEAALFDYTIYPTALFHKDATLMAARQRDAVLTTKTKVDDTLGQQLPTMVKSSYYDITITKPRPPVLGWCQAMARRGLCTLFADYFRTSSDERCMEACGLKWNFTPMEAEAE